MNEVDILSVAILTSAAVIGAFIWGSGDRYPKYNREEWLNSLLYLFHLLINVVLFSHDHHSNCKTIFFQNSAAYSKITAFTTILAHECTFF